jgi:SpoVK/Ycf46/Vps4 family AAA+-type ATPase
MSDFSDDDMAAGESSKDLGNILSSGSTRPLKAGDTVNVVGSNHDGNAGVITKFTNKKDKAYVQLCNGWGAEEGKPKIILLEHLVKTSGNTAIKKKTTPPKKKAPKKTKTRSQGDVADLPGQDKIDALTEQFKGLGDVDDKLAKAILNKGSIGNGDFKVGDRVEILEGYNKTSKHAGKHGEIKSFTKKGDKAKIAYDDGGGKTSDILLSYIAREKKPTASKKAVKKKKATLSSKKKGGIRREAAPEEEGETKENAAMQARVSSFIVPVTGFSMEEVVGLNKAKEALYESLIYPIEFPEEYEGFKTSGGVLLTG